MQVEGGDGGNSRAKYGTFAGTITAFGVGGPGARVSANFSVGDAPDQIPPGSYIYFVIGWKGASGNETIIPGVGSIPASESDNGTGGNGGAASSVWVKPPGHYYYQLLVAAGGGGSSYSPDFRSAYQ